MKKNLVLIFIGFFLVNSSFGQLLLGSANSSINFRSGPGLQYKIDHQIGTSNLLVVLPRAPQNGFIEVFDIETSSYGFVSQKLITITDTLNFQNQQFFEYAGENEQGSTEIELINGTAKTLFVWINSITYFLDPYEKKVLVFDNEDITFFSSAPDLFPVFGKEVLKKGQVYRWKFSL